MRRSRVKFYSEHDLGFGWNLQNAEEILHAWDCSYDEEDINEILNYYNIKRYFDANLRLKDWDESTITVLKDKCKAIPGLLGRYFAKISDFNLITVYKEVDREYLEDFWQLICDYKVYEKISATVINQLLNEKESALWYILHQKKLALKFGQVLADHLAANGQAAEWLMSHFLAAQDHPTPSKTIWGSDSYVQL